MEVLSILTAPTILHASITALKLAWQILAKVESYKHRSCLLVERCQSLLSEVCKDFEQGNHKGWHKQLQVLENACTAIRDALTKLAGKGFAWRLLHYEAMGNALAGAESKLMDAFMSFNIGAQVVVFTLQKEIADATAQDNRDLKMYLDVLSQNDQKILDALQEGQLRIEELLLALTKHVQSTGALRTKPPDTFINTAVGALQRLSRNIDTGDILHWQVTSLEITFDKNDESSYLGAGGFGKVYRGQWRGEVVAVKEMHVEDSRMVNRQKIQPFKKEISIWLRLNHPRILPFYGACLEASQPFIVTRYCANGNVLEYLRENLYANRVSILHQISSGMAYLHSQRVIHADLKAANILVGDDHKALISDFGLSHLKDQSLSHANQSSAIFNIVQGTLRWMAPELIEGEPLDYPADIYSFGITSWEIFTGLTPFSDIPDRAFHRRVIDKQERPACPSTMNKALWNLIQQSWMHDAAMRPSFSTLEASILNIIDENTASLKSPVSARRLPMPPLSEKQGSSIQSESTSSSGYTPSPCSHGQTATTSPPGSDFIDVSPETPKKELRTSSCTYNILQSTISKIGKYQSFDGIIFEVLKYFPNWLKLNKRSMVARGPHPQYVYKNRVKDSVTRYKNVLLTSVCTIPAIRDAKMDDSFRCLLLTTFTCILGEYSYRRIPDAPHLCVDEFIKSQLSSTSFKARVEASVQDAYLSYQTKKDRYHLQNALLSTIKDACTGISGILQ